MPKTMVFHRQMSERSLLIIMLYISVWMGIKAAPMQRICISRALSSHLSVMAMVMISGAVSASPNMQGIEMNAAKRSILRNMRISRSLSSSTCRITGCETLFVIPCTV